MAAGTGTSSVVSFVVALNSEDVVDLVDVDLGVDLLDGALGGLDPEK